MFRMGMGLHQSLIISAAVLLLAAAVIGFGANAPDAKAQGHSM